MRILHVLDHSLPVQSGYSFRSAAILREQRRLGWETMQVTGPKQGPSASGNEVVDRLEYFRTEGEAGWLRHLPGGVQIDVVIRLRARIRELIRRWNPDIIQAHSPCLNGLAALGLGKPLVYEFRSSWEDAAVSTGTTTEGSLRYRFSRWLETRVLRRADAVTTICEGLKQEALARGVPESRISVVPNAVDSDAFRVDANELPDCKTRWGLDGRYVLGFVGSFFAWEGLHLLLEALPAIRAIRPEVAILLIGGGADEAKLRQTATAPALAPHVVFAGRLPHEQIAHAYRAIDTLVFPRLPMRLTEMVTPLKPLEAMAMGKPVVASDVGGHRELIEDQRTGLLFLAGDVGSLTRVVVHLIGNAQLQSRLAEQGLRYVSEQRRWSDSVRGYAGPYGRLLEAAQR